MLNAILRMNGNEKFVLSITHLDVSNTASVQSNRKRQTRTEPRSAATSNASRIASFLLMGINRAGGGVPMPFMSMLPFCAFNGELLLQFSSSPIVAIIVEQME